MRLFARKTAAIEGYEAERLVDIVVRKTAAVTPQNIADSSAADVRLATIAAVALSGNRVLDFGGAAGLHYRIAHAAFSDRTFRWAVVETPAMATRARELETDALRFFTSIDAACDWLGEVDLMHAVGALQCVPEPEQTLTQLVAIDAPVMLWAKLDLGERREVVMNRSRLIENGPGVYLPPGIDDAAVEYPFTRMPQRDFLAAHSKYRMIWRDGTRAFVFVHH